MIQVFLNGVIQKNFTTLTEALVFARGQDIGVSFRIFEEGTLLAKGTIEDYKEGKEYE
jgi:hypothetical protein